MTNIDVVKLIHERDLLGEAAFAAYVQSGADTDGANNWQEFFRPITSPAWSTVVAYAVREAVQAAEADADWAEDLVARLTTAGISITIHKDNA